MSIDSRSIYSRARSVVNGLVEPSCSLIAQLLGDFQLKTKIEFLSRWTLTGEDLSRVDFVGLTTIDSDRRRCPLLPLDGRFWLH